MNSSRFPTAALMAVLVAGLTSAAAETLPLGTYRLQRQQVIDPNGFGQPMTAYTLLVPAGWSASGGINWQINNQGCGKAGTHVAWRAVSPDGSGAVELLAEESWGGNNLGMGQIGPCPNVMFTNARDFLQWYVQRERQGARILDYRDRPDMTQTLQALNRAEPGVGGGEIRGWVQAGEVLLGYQMNGRDTRESISMVVIFTLTRTPGVMPGEIRDFLIISTVSGLSVRMPHGQLDFHLAEAIRLSKRTDPRWQALMNEHTQKMSGISMKGATDRHNIRMKTMNEIADIRNQGYADSQASQDRMHQDFTQMIRGVENFVDTTSNERIELPNNYQHAWRLKDDTYILTDDPNFDPNRDLKLEASELKPERR